MKKVFLQLTAFRPSLIEVTLNVEWPLDNSNGDFNSISAEQAEQLLAEGAFPEVNTSELLRAWCQLTAPNPSWTMPIYGSACFLDRAQEIFLYGSLQKLGIITVEAKKKKA